jgi:hypothetical protein
LEDSSGNVLATTVTDSAGGYRFDQQNGLSATGGYNVSLVLPSGYVQTSADPAMISISRGDTRVRDMDYLVSGLATHLEVHAPSKVTTGGSFDVVVEAEDASNRLAAGYTGMVHFALGPANASAMLPADYTFTAGDHGRHVFHLTLVATGSQTVSVTDTTTSSITGQASVMVNAVGAVTHFGVFVLGPAVAGLPTQVLVVALDASNHVVPGYAGTVHFASSDGKVNLPLDSPFTASDQGIHLFSVTFGSTGKQTLTVTDTASNSILGNASVRVRSERWWRSPFMEMWGNGP